MSRFAFLGAALVAFAVALWPLQRSFLQSLDVSRSITYFIADGDPGSGYRDSDRDLAAWALEAWAEASEGRLRFEPAPEEEATIRIYWVRADAGQYGEMRPILIEGDDGEERRGAEVYIRPDTDALGPDIGGMAREDALFREAVVYLTCLHETGHALGLEHTDEFADIMYYFGYGGDIPGFFRRYRDRLEARDDIPDHSGISAGDRAQLAALYPG